LIAVILSNKEDGQENYKLNIEEIYRRSKGTEESQRRVFKSLQEKGIIKQSMTGCKKTGKIVWKYDRTGIEAYLILKEPSSEKQGTVKPDLVNTKMVTPIAENLGLNKTIVKNTNSNNTNEIIRKEEEKEKASKLNETELLSLNDKKLTSIEPEKQTEIETVACWPNFFPIEEKEETDFQSLIFEPITEELVPPVLEDFPYESHMAPREEVPAHDTMNLNLSTYAESEPFAVSMESDLLQGTKPMDTVMLEAKAKESSPIQLDVTRLNGKANLSLEEKQEIFDVLKQKFSERESEFSSDEVYVQSVRALATKLHNAEFKPGSKVVNNWSAYLTAAIQGIINDLNKKEIEEEKEWLKKKIRNMKAEGYEYVDGHFVDTKNVAGLKYGNK
jgi:hypothetical protein